MALEEMTCVVTGSVKATNKDGKVVQVPVGTRIDAAVNWRYRELLVKQGQLAYVPVSSLSPDTDSFTTAEEAAEEEASGAKEAVSDAADDAADAAGADDGSGDDVEFDQETYDQLNAEEVVDLLDDGTLDADTVFELESNRDGKFRKTIEARLEL